MAAVAALQPQPHLFDIPSVDKPTCKPIVNLSSSKRKDMHVEFDPKDHLVYEAPENIIMMKDIGYSEDTGVSPVAVSQPFRMFSTSAVQKFRDECLSDQVWDKYRYQSSLAACSLRGYATKHAPFIYDAWTHPETIAIVSKIAGIELIPNMNFEIGAINVSVKSSQEASAELDAIEREKQSYAQDEGISGCPWEDDKPVVGWHNDSYPFVCVVMLSDCTDMIGGETALYTGNGDIMRVRGPEMGCAVVLQGRYITHQALRALGSRERITMVTSFRPKSPMVRDDSVLTTVRGISVLSELYYEFSKYRLEMLEERIRTQLTQLRNSHAAGKQTNTRAIKKFLEESEALLKRTNDEMVPDEDVVAGHQPQMDIPNVKVENPLSSPPLHETDYAKKTKLLMQDPRF